MAALTEPPRFETKVEARDIRIPPSQRGRAGNPVCGRAELMGPNGWAAFTTVAHLNQRALWRDQFANRIYCREESSVAMLPMHGTPRADLRRCAWPFGSARRAPAPPEELQHASPADPPSQGHSKHRPTAQRDDFAAGPFHRHPGVAECLLRGTDLDKGADREEHDEPDEDVQRDNPVICHRLFGFSCSTFIAPNVPRRGATERTR